MSNPFNKDFIAGVGRAMDIGATAANYPDINIFDKYYRLNDLESMQSDWVKVGNSLKSAISQTGSSLPKKGKI